MILALNTAGDETQLKLLEQDRVVASKDWTAGRELSKTLLPEISTLLKSQSADWPDLKGVVVFEGPGSFTGLRIGCMIANSIAYSLTIPIVGGQGEDWLKTSQAKLPQAKPGQYVAPHYGSPPKITLPKAK